MGLTLQKGASGNSHSDVPRMSHESEYNYTQRHYHTHDANILALKYAEHSLKHIVRDGIHRILSLSLRVRMSHGARLKNMLQMSELR